MLVVMRRERNALDAGRYPAEPLTAGEAGALVLDAAEGIVSAADLQHPAGAYSFRSCSNADDPPYRAVINLTFAVPQGNPPRYLQNVANAMVRDGWTTAAVQAPHFGHLLTRAGTTSTFFRNSERTDLATMTLDGQCRVPDTAPVGWVDVTARLRRER